MLVQQALYQLIHLLYPSLYMMPRSTDIHWTSQNIKEQGQGKVSEGKDVCYQAWLTT